MNPLITETVQGEPYHYYPIGKYIVRAVGVCGGTQLLNIHELKYQECLNVWQQVSILIVSSKAIVNVYRKMLLMKLSDW